MAPFFQLLTRASVFWLGSFALFCGFLIVAGVSNPDSPLDQYLDAGFIAILWFPAAAGWLIGLVIQDFQHTSFAHPLPDVRSRLAKGYLATGLVVSSVVALLVASSGSAPLSLPVIFVLGLGAYCVSGTLQDPLSSWRTGLNTVLIFLVIGRSSELVTWTSDHPWITAAIAVAVGVMGCTRLFARSTFRRKPFRPTKPLPGRFSLEKSVSYERQRSVQAGSKTKDWRHAYLGNSIWGWVRAAVHETHGALGWRVLSTTIGRMWALLLLLLVYAWVDKKDMSFPEALGRAVYDALFRSPHELPFGDKGGPYPMVAIVIAAAVVVTALFRAVTLNSALTYPLSRPQQAQVAFRAGFVDLALHLLVLGLGLFLIGHTVGLALGIQARFDFMPFYFRVLMVALILMPLGHWGRIRLQVAARRKAENTVVSLAFGVTGFVFAVGLGVFILPLIFVSPLHELGTLIAGLVVSQLIYRNKLASYYQTADLG
jgi:hypothetical protein